jgi:Tyrosyl-DNA phosphodiesterase
MGDWSVWANQIWFKDFDLKSTTRIGSDLDPDSSIKVPLYAQNSKRIKNDFTEYLDFFISSIMKDKPGLIKDFCGIDINDYNINSDDLPFLIASINGYHNLKPQDKTLTGLARLGHICQNFKFKSSNPRDYRIYYQASSIGNPTISMLMSIIRKSQNLATFI